MSWTWPLNTQRAKRPAGWQPANNPYDDYAFVTDLWGQNGSAWSPEGRLLDYSYAGYMANDAPIPTPPVTVNLKTDFGAAGDNVTDDTQALIAAIANVSSSPAGGVILIPSGIYLLTQQIVIQGSNVVLRGEGQRQTVLYFSRSLTQIYGQTWKGHGSTFGIQSDYKSGPGLIRFAGPLSYDLAGPGHTQIGVSDPINNGTLITRVNASAMQGEVVLRVADNSNLTAGMWVTLTLSDKDGSLLNALYGGINVPLTCYFQCINQARVMRFHSRIYSVHTKGRIILERPLPWNVNLQWEPELHAFQPGIQHSGIENMMIRFRWNPYAGHLMEEGWNAVEFAGAANCWARNLLVVDSDNAITVWMSSFITVLNVKPDVSKNRGSYDCHHAVNVTWSQDVLIRSVELSEYCFHDISSFSWNNAVVFSNISGVRMCMDHHKLFPYGTLWTNIDLGDGRRAFQTGGEPWWGMQAAALTTFYNIRAWRGNITDKPASIYGPFLNLLYIQWDNQGSLVPNINNLGWLVSGTLTNTTVLPQPDLFLAMLSTRNARFASLSREFLKWWYDNGFN